MAKHDIVVLNSTSSGFETDLGNNVARIKGDASSVFAVKSGSGESVFSVGTSDTSVTFLGHLTASGHITSSASSTASFGRVDVDFLTGDASQMTFVDQRTHVSSSAQLAKRISGAFDHGFESTGDISGSITSTGSFGLVYANSYSGDASQTTNVNEDGHFSGSAQFATRLSGSFTSGINFAGGSNLSGSATSTGSFSRVVFSGVAAGDASGITINQNGFISSSEQIASQISGSFNKGFDYGGIISGSATSTASFGRVNFSNTLTGNASQMTNVPIDAGTLSGSAQIESQISGSFNKGFEFVGSISGSANSTGSFSLLEFSKLVTSDVSGVTNAEIQSVPNLLSSSAQISDRISGSFQSGFASWNYSGSARTVTVAQGFQARATSSIYGNKSFTNISNISGSATSTASFAFFRSDYYVGDGSEITNLNGVFNPVLSGSFHIASQISGSFNKGFSAEGSISGSADSTGSFSRIVGAKFNSFDATSVSGITNVSEVEGAVSGAAQIASYVSGSFNKGFNLNANSLISGSVKSTGSFGRLEGIATLNVTNFENVVLDAAGNQAIFSLSDLSARISGAIEQPALSIGANFSGSNNSTASLQHIEVNQIETKELEAFRRLDASGSFIGTQTFKPFVIPTRGRVDHTMVTKQFIATGSMESQKYRNQAGQLFVDNWGRLNMTVQTGSLVAQPAAWTLVGSGEALSGRSGGMIAQSTKAALVLPSTGMAANCTRIFDGITIFGGPNLPFNIDHCGWSHAYQGLGNGVDDGLQAGAGFGRDGKLATRYDGNSWSVSTSLPQDIYSSNGQPKAFNAPGVTTGGGGALIGGPNRCKVYEWTGVSWELGGTRNHNIGGGGAAGTVYAGLAFGGKETPSPAQATCTEEYNGVSWATAASMPHELDTVGAGTQNAAVMAGGGTQSPHTHGPFGASDDTFEYNGTAWSTSVDMLNYMTQQGQAGGTGTLISGPGLHGWSNGIGAIFEPGFITGSNARTACNYGDNDGALYEPVVDQFSKNTGGKYLLTKKLQANASPSVAGLRDSGSSDGYGGGY